MRPVLVALLSLHLVGSTATAEEDRLCGRCGTTGKIANELVDPPLIALESNVKLCSWRIERDPQGKALPFVPCQRCLAPSKAAAAEAEFAALAAPVTAWMQENAAIDANLRPRNGFIHIETEHFRLVFGLPRVNTDDRVRYSMHEAAHLYAARLEDLYAWLQNLIGYTDENVRNTKHQVFLLDDLRTLVKAANDYAQCPTDRAGRAVGDPSIFVTWRDKTVFKTDGAFHQHVDHHMSHQLLGVYFMKVWLVERAGWLEEGLAHVCEMRRFGRAGNTCNTEQSEEDMPDENWEPIVKKLVLAGETISLADVKDKRADLLDREEHLFAWSFVDFLIARGPEKLRQLIQALKQDVDLRDALRDVYGMTVVGFQTEWDTWVRQTYRLKVP